MQNVHLVQQEGNGLDCHVIRLVLVKLDLTHGVAVRQIQLTFVGGQGIEAFDQVEGVLPNA